MQPHPVAALTAVADELDAQLGAHQVDGAEPGDELIGRHPHAERDLVGDLERRLERDLAVQLGRWRARLDGSRVASAGEAVKTDAALSEALAHPVLLHRRELAERLHAQPGEQPDEIGGRSAGRERRAGSERRRLEHRDGQRREEPGSPARRDDEHRLGHRRGRLGRLLRRERPIGDPCPHPLESRRCAARRTSVSAASASPP